jgi:aminopeptidase N
MQAHKLSNSTTADLWNALGEASKKPVSAMAASWTEQPGLPLVSIGPGKSGLTISQERFTVHQKNPKPLEWKIPLAWREAQTAAVSSAPGGFLLEQKSARLPDVSAGQIVKLNAGDVGYFRVAYESVYFGKLVSSAPQWPEADKVNLMSDTWALVAAERRAIGDYFKLVEALREGDGLAQWEQIIAALSFIDSLCIGSKDRPAFQAYGRSLLRPAFDRVGWDATPGEEAARGLLRAALISALSDFADQDVIAAAQERFRNYLVDPKTLPPNLRPAVLDVVGHHADQNTWDKLHELGLKTQSIEEKGVIYLAMATALDPDLARQSLALSLTDELPTTRATRLVFNVSAFGEQPALAWEFAQAQRKQLDPKLGTSGRLRFAPDILRAFSDAKRATELESYAQKFLPPDAKSEIAKTAEEIRFKADLKRRLLPDIAKWIAAKAPSAP